jgi:predicted DCC family thiol-disulfide oxidoreductase YuxK
MRLNQDSPIVVFDNQCYLCVKFAKFVDFFGRGKMKMVGHYTEEGETIREKILDESALEMFWFIDEKRAYGGRSALLPVIKTIFSNKPKRFASLGIKEQCTQDCKTVKAVFVRSTSLITNSKIIEIRDEDNI